MTHRHSADADRAPAAGAASAPALAEQQPSTTRPAPMLLTALQRAAGNHAVSCLVTRRASGGRPLQRFVPADATETTAATTALDQLLGAGQDPGGCRAAITTASPSLGSLQAAVASIIATVPLVADRQELAREVLDVEVLVTLLLLATHTANLGSPGKRLRRVLADSPLLPRTALALTGPINAAKLLDQKILRGSLAGNVPATLAAGVPATGQNKAIIGGHSAAILNAPGIVMGTQAAPQPNLTQAVSFYKSLRDDAGVAATAVSTQALGNIGTVAEAAADRARELAAMVPPPAPPMGLLALPQPAQAAFTNQVNAHGTRIGAVTAAHGGVAGLHAGAIAAATANLAAPGDATRKTFVDSVMAMMTGVDTVTRAARLLVPTLDQDPAVAAFDPAKAQFLTHGPAFSTKKTSTLAPPAWTDEDILEFGDRTAQVAATLWAPAQAGLGPPAPPAAQPAGTLRTKHQLVINHAGHIVVWVTIKAGVTYQAMTNTFTGGTMTSSFPTAATVIPAPPNPGVADPDGFYAL